MTRDGFERISCPERVKFLAQKFEDMEFLETARQSGATIISGASDQMASIKRKLEEIGRVLLNPTTNWEKAASKTRKWLDELARLCGNAEEIIFAFLVEAEQPVPSAVMRICTKPVNFSALYKFCQALSKIQTTLQEIIDGAYNFGIDLHPDREIIFTSQSALPSLCPTIQEAELVGTEPHYNYIMERLLRSTPSLSVIKIEGEQGSGKSVLAQKIYLSDDVKYHFDFRFWIFHGKFEPLEVLRTMLARLDPEDSLDGYDKDHLILRIQQSLKEKRYLIIFDHIILRARTEYSGNKSDDIVALLKLALPDENNGSRVLVVPKYSGHSIQKPKYGYDEDFMPSDPKGLYTLPRLSNEDCLKLALQKLSIGKDRFDEHPPVLQRRAKDIAPRCAGRPGELVIACGHMLYNPSVSPKEIKPFRSDVYSNLPSVLKTCFGYAASLYPCDYVIHADSLVQLWIAEGLVQPEEGQTLEDKAESYLQEFVQRGFMRVIWVHYHNLTMQPIRSVVLHSNLQMMYLRSGGKHHPVHNLCMTPQCYEKIDAPDEPFRGKFVPSKLEEMPKASWSPSSIEEYKRIFEGGDEIEYKKPTLHSLLFISAVPPSKYLQFYYPFVRVVALFGVRVWFPEEDTACWLDGLPSLRYLGFIVCWVKGGLLGVKLSQLKNLHTLDLSESFVSDLSVFLKRSMKVKVVGSFKEKLPVFWSPVPDLCRPKEN